MKRGYLVCLVIIIFAAGMLSGCETVPKKVKEDISTIKTKVDTLESRVEGVETKQADIERATGEQAKELEDIKSTKGKRARTNIGSKPRFVRGAERLKEIQICLKNAGFYNGAIDGIKGKETRRAIIEFQKANGLKADGIVGKRTWEALSKYLQGAAADAAQTAVEEGPVK